MVKRHPCSMKYPSKWREADPVSHPVGTVAIEKWERLWCPIPARVSMNAVSENFDERSSKLESPQAMVSS